MADSSPKVHRMGIWFKMIPIAIILGGRTDRILLCGLLAIAALFSAPFITGEGTSEIQAGLSGKRIDFGINNAQHPAMISGVLFLSLLAALITNINSSLLKRFWLYGMLILTLFMVATIVISTQTRGVWLGLLVAIPSILLTTLLIRKQTLKDIIRKASIGILFIVIFLFTFQDVIQKRVVSITQSFETNSDQTIGQRLMKDRSFYLRASTWEDGLEWISKKPLLGWGGNIEKHIVADTSERLEKVIPFRHLHNSYLDTLANYGISGLAILLLLCIYLVFCAHKSWRSNTMPTPIYLFLIGFFPFWLVVNIFESYFFYSSGEYIIAIVGAIILSYYWKAIAKKTTEAANLS